MAETTALYTLTYDHLIAQGIAPDMIMREESYRCIGRCTICKKGYAHDVLLNACQLGRNSLGQLTRPARRPRSPLMQYSALMCCQSTITYHVVKGEKNLAHACNDKCLFATGPACSCACGGDNHGSRLITLATS